MMETEPIPLREHLFINYAYEQGELAMWLALKLTGEGYRVWIDQLQLLGGEPFPTDIDRAIQDRSFRVLAILSRDAMDKPNPRGERTLALSVGKALGIPDFVIPLRADDLRPEKMDFQISDRTFIDFSSGWADGFARLLKKLESISTPKTLPNPRDAVASWYSGTEERVLRRSTTERIWTNAFEFLEVPEVVTRVQAAGTAGVPWPSGWPQVQQGLSSFVFEVPPGIDESTLALTPYRWAEASDDVTLRLRPRVADLLRQYVLRRGRALGLLVLEHGGLYFPQGLLPDNKLRFDGYQGKATFCQVVGERNFSLGNERREKVRYHLAITPRVDLRQPLGVPSLRIGIQLYLTYLSGAPLSAKHAHSRRRRICMHWFNHEWLNRVLAAGHFFADGLDQINLAAGPRARILLAGRPHQLTAPTGIDEGLLGDQVATLPAGIDDDEDDQDGALPVA